jgi:hypothetical protein
MVTASQEPPPAGEVAMDGSAETGVTGDDDDELRQLPDQVLQGRMERMQRGVDGGIAARLPDGGKTYRLMLLAISREVARRQAAAALSAPPPPSSSSRPLTPRQGEPSEPPVRVSSPLSGPQPSFLQFGIWSACFLFDGMPAIQ